MQTLDQQYPEAYRNLKAGGFTSICGMMRRLYRGVDMDRALGHNGACSNWMRQTAVPSRDSERKAAKYLRENPVEDAPKQPSAPVVTPTNMSADTTSESTLLVVCEPSKSVKVQKVLALLGCEVVEV